MYSKVFFVLALTSMAYSHDVIEGSNHTSERLIYDEHLRASPAIWKQSSDVTVNASDHEVISKVNITDLRQDKDGDVKIVAGGVGQNNITITIKSPTILRGYDFLIQVYSIPESQQSDGTTEAQVTTARNGPTIVTRAPEVTGTDKAKEVTEAVSTEKQAEVVSVSSNKKAEEVTGTDKPKEVTESVSTEKPAQKVTGLTDKPMEVTEAVSTEKLTEEVSESTNKPAEVNAASMATEIFTKTTMESERPVEIEHQPKLKS